MKIKYIIPTVAALAASCSPNTKETTASTSTSEETTATDDKTFHKSQTTALQYVDLDGKFLSLNNVSGEMELVRMFADLMEVGARSDRNMAHALPASVHFRDLLAKTKLDTLNTVAASSKQVDGGWINKAFFDFNGTQDGVLTAMKGKGGEWSAYDFAPAETDMVMEFDLNLENVRGILEMMMSEFPQQKKDQMLGMFDKNVQREQTLKMVAEGVHARVSFIAQIDRKHKVNIEEGIEGYNANAVTRIEGLTKFWEKFGEKLMADFELEEKDGLKYYRMPAIDIPERAGNVPPLTITVVVDEAKDQIWLSSRESFLNECLGAGKKLKDAPAVVELMKDLSSSGNGFTFISHDMLSYYQELYNSEASKRGQLEIIDDARRGSEREVVRMMLKMIDSKVVPALVASKQGFAMTIDLNKDGVLVSSKTPVAMKSASFSAAAFASPILAGVSVPIIKKQIAKSRATTAINNSKDIYIGIRDYNIQHGKLAGIENEERSSNYYFRAFFEKKAIIDEKPFYVKGAKGAFEGDGDVSAGNILERGSNVFSYFPGANIVTDAANRQLLMTPLIKRNGKVIVDTEAYGNQVVILTCDGACSVYPVSGDGTTVRDYNGEILFRDGYGYYKDYEGKSHKIKVALPEM